MRGVIVLFVASLFPAFVCGGQFATETFHGDVLVRSSGDQRMAILLDAYGAADAHDGLADHAWVIASETPYASQAPLFLRDARVTSEPGRITVYSPSEHKAIVFLADGKQDDDSSAPSGTTFTRYNGYGLSLYSGELRVPPITVNGVAHTPSSTEMQEPDPWNAGG